MNPSHEEVMAICSQYEDAVTITPAQLRELASYAGLEPNYGTLVDLRDDAREALTIHEALPPSLDRYLSTGDENGLEQMQRIDAERVRRLRPYVWALCILGSWLAVALVVLLAVWIGGTL